MKASCALHELVARQATELRDAGVDIRRFQAVVEFKQWPSHAPSFQVTLTVGYEGKDLTVNAGEFGSSTPFLAIASAGRQLRDALGRLSRGAAARCTALPGPWGLIAPIVLSS